MDTFPPKIRTNPSPSGGFYKYPKKDRTVEAFSSLQLGPSSQLIDLNPLCPGSRSVREQLGVNFMYKRYNPVTDDRLENLRSIATANPDLGRQLQSRPSLVTSFSGIIDYVGDLDIQFEESGMISRGSQTSPPLFRNEIDSIAQSQKWTKETVEPFLKELRQSIFSNKPEDLKEFIMAYCFNSIKNEPPPATILRPDPDEPDDPEDEDEDSLVVTGKKKKKNSKKKKKKKGGNLDYDDDDDEKSISNKPTSNKVTSQNSIIKVHIESSHAGGVSIGGTGGLNRGLSLGEGGMSHLSSVGGLSRRESHFKLGGGGGGGGSDGSSAAIPHLPDLNRLNRDL